MENIKENKSYYNVNSFYLLFFKRFFDIILSISLITLFLPFFILIPICIKLSSKGNIFFKQERVTQNNKKFYMYKFRSMIENAELDTGPIFADNNDKRCTKIGLILRKLSLDEIPQFFNVLKGDMSLVGPRPERPYYIDIFSKDIPNYNNRHSVKTGITGLSQIKGLRGKTSIKERTKYDLDYINKISLFYDLNIIFNTIIIILVEFIKFIKTILLSQKKIL
ncbi:MAG: sugar transferase [Candidatus Sericytochromatia bacterium]